MNPLANLKLECKQYTEKIRSHVRLIFIFDGRYIAFCHSEVQSNFNTCIQSNQYYNFVRHCVIDIKNFESEGSMTNNLDSRIWNYFSVIELPYKPVVLNINLLKFSKLLDKYEIIPKEEIIEYCKPLYDLAFFYQIYNTVEDSNNNAKELLKIWLKEEEVKSILHLGYVEIKSKLYPNTSYKICLGGATFKEIHNQTMNLRYKMCVESVMPDNQDLNLYDQLLGKICLLKTDEREYERIARLLKVVNN